LGPNAREPGLPIVFAGIMAVLGAVASGFLSATGWAMLAGGIVGAIVTGMVGVVATFHLKGLIYSFWGAPVGAWLVYQCWLGHERKSPTIKARVVTRGEIAETLRRWQAAELTAREVYDWAQELYRPGRAEFDDWEADDSSAANEVLGALDQLPMNLILPEDMPAYLEFLKTPSGRFAEGYERFQAALDRIDYAARARSLRDDDFYGRFCGADG
jgi:hypothetical protein